MSDDLRNYYSFMGVHTDDWQTIWGGQTYNKHLVKNMISVYCNSTASTAWVSTGCSFIFPHNIKKIFFLEGVVEGEICFGHDTKSFVSDFRVNIFKHNTDTTVTTLATTGIISVNDVISAADAYQYHFWIDVFDKKELNEYDRIGVLVEWDINNSSSATAKLLHEVVSSDYDLWVDIPLML